MPPASERHDGRHMEQWDHLIFSTKTRFCIPNTCNSWFVANNAQVEKQCTVHDWCAKFRTATCRINIPEGFCSVPGFQSGKEKCQRAECRTETGFQAFRYTTSVMVVPGGSAPSCYYCNSTSDLTKECKFRAANCRHCGKVGHIQTACHTKGKTQDQEHRGKNKNLAAAWSPGDYSLIRRRLITKHLPVVSTPCCTSLCACEVGAGGHPMELDTGASVTFIRNHCQIRRDTNTMVSAHRGEATDIHRGRDSVVGRVTVNTQHLEQEEQLSLVVVAGEGPSLLDRDWFS